jgi:hypothetical protein
LIDSDAVLALSVASELFQSISGRHSKVIECVGSVEDQELAQRDPVRGLVQPSRPLSLPDKLGLLVAERPQHPPSITLYVINVKRHAG